MAILGPAHDNLINLVIDAQPHLITEEVGLLLSLDLIQILQRMVCLTPLQAAVHRRESHPDDWLVGLAGGEAAQEEDLGWGEERGDPDVAEAHGEGEVDRFEVEGRTGQRQFHVQPFDRRLGLDVVGGGTG